VSAAVSPWEAVLGDRVDSLHPRLHAYFARIPDGEIGRGSGVFSTVGTPRRWLWPMLAILARMGIIFPVWERNVPFTVENRTVGASVTARRTFQFSAGSRTMVDTITAHDGFILDALGTHGVVEAAFVADVVGGALSLRSTRSRLRLGRVRVPMPGITVHLSESVDMATGLQHVSLTMTAALVGRLYEYAGTFDYRVGPA
jgi:hypothetical protein